MVSLAEGARTTLPSGLTITALRGSASVEDTSRAVPGRRGERADGFVSRLREQESVLAVVDAVEVSAEPATRSGSTAQGAAVRLTAPDGPGFALLLVWDEGTGLWSWHVPDAAAATSGGDAPAFTVDVAASPGPQRGIAGRIAGRVVTAAVCRLGDKLLEEAGTRLAGVFEQRYRPEGLRMVSPEGFRLPRSSAENGIDDAALATLASGPSLLFLHDVFMLSHTGLARLPDDLLEGLCGAYQGRTWAYDHHTLSVAPEQNASTLVHRLQELGAARLTVDVIAHGRGGLVARELVEHPRHGSPLTVRSVTFLGTPNAGTPACDLDHLLRLADRVTNLLALVPDNPVTDVIDAIATVAAAVAARAGRGFVGITSMAPGSPALERLNAQRPPADVIYRAVVSDFDPPAEAPIASRFRNLAFDGLFGRVPNDLMVPTASTYDVGGDEPLVERENRVECRPQSAVDHYGIWESEELAYALRRWHGSPTSPTSPTSPPATRDARPPRPATAGHRSSVAPRSGGTKQEVVVKVVHGSLECASHHLLVGHFVGSPIKGSGAEGFLDDRFDQRLSARALLGQYPEQLGESAVIDYPVQGEARRRGYPPGAIVVGLGRPGELTRESLTATVTDALVQQAVVVLEQRLVPTPKTGDPELLRYSAVPMGSSGLGALSLEACVAALADAVVAANDRLYRHDDPLTGERAWDHVRVAELEILEVNADRAEVAGHATRRVRVLMQVPEGDHTRLQPVERVYEAEGALPAGPSTESAAGDWQRVIIRDLRREQGQRDPSSEPSVGGATVLEYTAVGRRARADRMQVTIDTGAIEALVAAAIDDQRPGAQIGNTLYELLLPTELKGDLVQIENIQLIVDEHTADLPWEALTARPAGRRERELALRGGFLRQFRETEGGRRDVRFPTGDNVLVVGNPPAGAVGPPLDGARDEAVAVAALLEDGGFDVGALVWGSGQGQVRDDFQHLVGTPARRILDALFSREWRVLHLAGHGRFDERDSSRSGVVIGDNLCISANVVHQLPVVPELVFLNCCHLGRITETRTGVRDANRLAASVARELMGIGVRAVVAAGWAVDDDAAVVFAETFYGELVSGSLLGPAVYRARAKVRQEFPSSLTWAAFQCYGDPGYHLRTPHAGEAQEQRFVSRDELIRRVQTVSVLAAKIGLPDFRDITEREADLVAELDSYWCQLPAWGWETPVVLYELGAAYGDLGQYEKAVDCYRRAWSDPLCHEAPIKLLEQLGNMEIRLAQQLFRTTGSAEPRTIVFSDGGEAVGVDTLVQSAGEHLELALGLGATGERLALLGSYHKKAATMSDGEQRSTHLQQSRSMYRRAHEWHLEHQQEIRPYFALNWLQMATLAGTPVPRDQADQIVKEVEADGSEEGFWNRSLMADVALTRAIIDDETDLAALGALYADAFATRASRRNRDSVTSHLRDLADLHCGEQLALLAQHLDAPQVEGVTQ